MFAQAVAGSIVLAATLLAVVAPAHASAGYLDSSFNGDGTRVTDFGDDTGPDIAIQADGRIVVAGRAGADFALARYNADGSLDLTFSGDGKLTTDFGGASKPAASSSRRTTRSWWRAGATPTDFALARYNADGSLDATFAGDGKLTTDFGGSDGAEDVASSRTTGRGGGKGQQRQALARYNPDGSPDTTFSGDGMDTTDFGGGAAGVAIQADDRIVTAGRDGSDFALARYQPRWLARRQLSGDGMQSTDFGGDDSAMEVTIQADGKIVAAGTAIRPSTPSLGDFALGRYT